MLATLHTLPIPRSHRPTGQEALGGVPAREIGVTRGPVLPAVDIHVRRVARWPSTLPKLMRPSRTPQPDEVERTSPQRVAPAGLRRDRARLRQLARPVGDDRGAVTAEYAVVILAAVAFAGLLVAILRSDEVRAMLVQLVQNALGSAG